jgi:hypothetical protein
MPDYEGPTPGGSAGDPSAPTQPIRPSQAGSEPIPERVRQPIVVPHHESTIGGLPRAFVVAGVVALALALGAGFLIGRSFGGDDEARTGGVEAGRGGGCRKALSLSLQVVELQKQAITNRTQVAQAVALDDEGQIRELNSAFEALAPAIQEAETQLGAAVEKCQSGAGRGKGKRRGGQDGGKGGG